MVKVCIKFRGHLFECRKPALFKYNLLEISRFSTYLANLSFNFVYILNRYLYPLTY